MAPEDLTRPSVLTPEPHLKRKRTWPRWLLWGTLSALILAFLCVTGISAFVGWSLTHPPRKPLTGTPSQLGLNFTNITFPSRTDHLPLSGWYVPAPQANAIVIEAHGYGGNRCGDKPSLPVAEALWQKGISTLLFDFRDSGVSPGNLVSVGDFEQRDLLGAVDCAKALGYRHIGIIGYSMGAATAALVGAKDPDVAAMVLDSPFADLRTYLETGMPHWTHLPNFPFTPLILTEIPLLTGANPARVSPIKTIAQMKARPVLFIAGDADTTIPMINSVELYDQAKNPKDSLWIVHRAKHVGAYSVEPREYLAKVSNFFVQNLTGDRGRH
ncbi:Alpha/Beta hydrolase fold [Acididesulfobacillus acetoxydans]|uniref:Alpha/Beta hydrolase fold n=1 Tax=Acididesulfobacillus acetoxydans TaxID=1561005 RepID=A0A8S0W3G0_9FIRM|nr:alpha/beta hydrolase [Acididesulfobacillus acetoxydans]CAA7601638.1 Alpha/Beta hydrolase fold [Acididesulfobacillus acetoxydans]CEJ07125.1 Hydrolase of the alpha/beta super [Acididesulfobacillus acetoxydans]